MLKTELEKRIPGFLYLILAITGFYTPFVMGKFSTILNAAQWYELIIHNQLLFSSGILSFYLMNISWLLLAFSLYNLFKGNQKTISNLLLLSVLSGSIIVFIQIISQSAPLYLMLLNHQQPLANSAIWIERAHFLFVLGSKSNISAFLFYSIWLFPLAILILKARKITKIEKVILSVSLFLAGIGYMADFLFSHLLPQQSVLKITQMTFYGEVVVLLWLLIRGVEKDQ
jgi:hypothetical protein